MAKSILIEKLITCSEFIGSSGLNNPSFLMQRFEYLQEMKEYELAVQDAVKAISIDEYLHNAYSSAIDCYVILGNVKEADKLLTKFKKVELLKDSIDSSIVSKIAKLKLLKKKIDKEIVNEKNE